MRVGAILAIFVGLGSVGQAEDAGVYLDTIKPLLAERCYACHGALKQRGKLRVDTAQSLRDAGVVEDGALLARLVSRDPDERMPPEGEPLHSAEIEAIRAWISKGAAGPADEVAEDDPKNHWSFQTIERPELPEGDFENPIDAFLGQKHRALGLSPQPTAARSTLLRRLYLDLIGLPPSAEQLASEAPLDTIVDDLLASPQHGERWGRHWMDVWRYSDGYGLGNQLRYSQRHLWHWRDWIVNSLNEDKGYDRMILEMLAGDEIAPGDPEVVAGTGFLARNYYLFNRTTWLDSTIEHTGKAFVGLTMNCAKCHDHKYDPISHDDYYRFRAFFEPHQIRLDPVPGETDFSKNGLPRAYDDQLEAETFLHRRGNPEDPEKGRAITPGVPAILASFATAPQPVALPVEAWAPGVRDYVQQDHLAAAEERVERMQADLKRIELAIQERPASTTERGERGVALKDSFDSERPETWTIFGDSWRYQGGSLVQLESTRDKRFARSLDAHPEDFELTVSFRTTGGGKNKSVGVRFDLTALGENAHTVYTSARDRDPKVQIAHTRDGQTTYPAGGRAAQAIELHKDYRLKLQARGTLINVSLNGEFLMAYTLPERNPNGVLELFAFEATAEFDSISVIPLEPETPLVESDQPAAEARSEDTLALARAILAEAESALTALRATIASDNATLLEVGTADLAETARLKREHAVAAARVAVLSAKEGGEAGAKKALAKAESQLKKSSEAAGYEPLRGSLKALETPEHKEPDYPATYPKSSTGRRSALARWITDRDNPLTARVAANQIWLRHMGAPIVETVFDFGRQAPKPEHAELLDFLAMELIESGWSMKHLHRLIVTSEAYRRSSSNRDAAPETLEKDPTNRFLWRMNSRRMESQVVRDSLVSLGGVLSLELGGPSIDPKPEARRRSLYFKHSRDQQSPLLATFDDAEILACYRRSESIIPQQALALSNSRIAIEMSELLSTAIGKDLSDLGFAAEAFSLVLCRAPNQREIDACVEFLTEEPDRSRLVHALFNHNDFVTIR